MRRLTTILTLCATLAGSLAADFSSLTAEERERVVRAYLAAARYNRLAAGDYTISVTNVTLVNKRSISDRVEQRLYRLDTVLAVSNDRFYGRVLWTADFTFSGGGASAWGYVAAAAAGVVVGLLARR